MSGILRRIRRAATKAPAPEQDSEAWFRLFSLDASARREAIEAVQSAVRR